MEPSELLLTQALSGILESIKETKDFALEHAPDVIQQVLAYKLITASFWILISAVIVSIFAITAFKTCKGEHPHDKIFCWFIFTLCSIIPLIALVSNILIALKITLAPKVYILEYTARLLL